MSKNTRSWVNIIFTLLCLSLIGWTTANVISINTHNPDHIFAAAKVVLFFVVLQNFCFYLFSRSFPAQGNNLRSRHVKIYISLSLIVIAVALKGLFFKSYTYQDNKLTPVPSPFMAIFLAFVLYSIIFGFGHLIRRYRSSKGILRNQLLYLIIGSFLLFIVVPATNFILPLVFKNNLFISGSPVYTLAFTSIIAYAIVRQKLFDIRLVVATSVAYILSLATLGLIYSSFIFALSQLFFGKTLQTNLTSEITTITFVVVLAFLFQPVKSFFDRITNGVFYRDAYDSQTVLNDINKLLTREIHLEKITSTSLRIICNNLKISRGYFAAVDNGVILHSSNYPYLHPTDILLDELRVFKKTITVAPILSGGDSKEILDKHGYEIALRLATQDGVVGYVLLSEKQSGNIYTDQDVKLLLILAAELAVGLQNALAFEEIKQFNVTLEQKVDEATKKLRHANARLKELDKTKDEFISMASHQLRTPLTTIKGYLSMILDGDVGKVKAEEKELIKRAYDSSENMVDLIADLLNVSRLQSGKFVIENKPTDLAQMVDAEVKKLKDHAKRKDITLSFKKPASFPILSLDETKMRQVVMNFLDNAIYYTPAGGSVSVALESNQRSISYKVIDNGMGVPKAVQHHLFSKFYRADNARKMRPDGTGLGLFMAKKVIVAQGGSIIFESEEGKGSTFGFSFPKTTV